MMICTVSGTVLLIRILSSCFIIQIYNFMGFHMISGLKDHLSKRGELGEVTSVNEVDEESANEESDAKRNEVTRLLSRSTSYRHSLQCAKKVPVASISFDIVETVIESWQKILAIPDWSKVTGELFLRYIFKLEAGTINLFGFPVGTDYLDPELTSNIKFTTKGVVLIKAIDTSVQMLGPDLYPLEDALYDLGRRHVIMKAQPEYWPIVGEALFLVFEECLGKDGFSPKVRDAWTVIYNFLGYHMIEGLKSKYAEMAKDSKDKAHVEVKKARANKESDAKRNEVTRLLSRSTSYRHSLQCAKKVPVASISFDIVETVIESWQKILAIPDWSKVTGELFLRYIFKLEPGTINLFGFPAGTDYLDPELTSNIKFTMKGVVLIKAIDVSVQMLGPDLYPLEDALYDLGRRHVIMKAQPEYWPIVGEALFLVFEECLGKDGFSPTVRDAWTVIYNFLGYHMIRGLKSKYAEMAKVSMDKVHVEK
jgi:hemoglobin-like flavoprotein